MKLTDDPLESTNTCLYLCATTRYEKDVTIYGRAIVFFHNRNKVYDFTDSAGTVYTVLRLATEKELKKHNEGDLK